MYQLILGLVLFIGMHSASIVALPVRNRLAAKNENAWKGVYSLVSLIGLVLIVRGYADLRQTPTVLYVTPYWMKHVAAVLLLPIFTLFLASIFPGRIKSVTRHPLLIAVKTWAVAHLLVNGTLADVLLFGSFLIWAVAVRVSLKRRPARAIPEAPQSRFNDAIVVAGGLGLYVATVLWLHELLFGIRPFT